MACNHALLITLQIIRVILFCFVVLSNKLLDFLVENFIFCYIKVPFKYVSLIVFVSS